MLLPASLTSVVFLSHDAGEPLLVSIHEAQVRTEDAQKRM